MRGAVSIVLLGMVLTAFGIGIGYPKEQAVSGAITICIVVIVFG